MTTLAFVFTGMLAGLAALVLAARSHAARPDVVQGMSLTSSLRSFLAAAACLGDAASFLAHCSGSLIIGTLNNVAEAAGSEPADATVIKERLSSRLSPSHGAKAEVLL